MWRYQLIILERIYKGFLRLFLIVCPYDAKIIRDCSFVFQFSRKKTTTPNSRPLLVLFEENKEKPANMTSTQTTTTTTGSSSSNTNNTVSFHLPPPRKTQPQSHSSNHPKVATTTTTTSTPSLALPIYVERCQAAIMASSLPKQERPKLFVPRQLSDFGDGGAYPEIHVAQYPRHMGNPHLQQRRRTTTTAVATGGSGGGNGGTNSTTRNNNHHHQVAATISNSIVNVEVDETGGVSYDAIVKGGTNADKLVYTKLDDMRGGDANPDDIALPTPEEEAAEAERTNAALQALLMKKTALDKASGSAIIQAATSQNIESKTDFIKYTARPDAPGYNPAASTRIIQMVPAKIDPLMPPKHKHIKAPRGPAEDPVPVLQAPPTKLTKEEQEAWKIPTCISNWKNPRGYTIPLDKRLAADGRGLLLSVNDVNTKNFAALAESLSIAERQARQEVRLRALTQQKLVLAEAEEREAALRKLAQQARLERGGGGGTTTTTTTMPLALPNADDASIDSAPSQDDDDDDDDNDHDKARNHSSTGNQSRSAAATAHVVPTYYDTEDDVAARQREKLRIERKRERERELRYEANVELKKKQRLEEERDVSEKIALGVHSTGTGGGGMENVDSRLYNQSGGMDSGFGADDEYNTYTKPLFATTGTGGGSSSIYRPTRGETEYNADEQYDQLRDGATSKFQPHVGFGGAENFVSGAGPRTEPVQFEKASSK
jgi:SNW domain-containing protein 1